MALNLKMYIYKNKCMFVLNCHFGLINSDLFYLFKVHICWLSFYFSIIKKLCSSHSPDPGETEAVY